MDDDALETLRLYRSMRTTELHVLHLAFMLDLETATSADTRVFCLGRIRLVRQLLRERVTLPDVIEEETT